MTKLELADGVILLMGYNSADKKLDRRLVWFVADRIIPMLIDRLAKSQGMSAEDVADNFITVKDVDVKFSTKRQALYADLPTPMMNIAGFSSIRQVGDSQDETTVFVPVKQGQQAIIKNLEVGGLGGRIGYRLEGTRLWFINMPQGEYSSVMVKYLPSITGLKEDEQITIPASVEADLVNMIMQSTEIQKITPEDKTVNNVDSK